MSRTHSAVTTDCGEISFTSFAPLFFAKADREDMSSFTADSPSTGGGSARSPERPSGTLFIVATPIGNLEDITLRALRTLREADLIAAEDTRVTLKLLSHYGISKPLTSYHRHSPKGVVGKIVSHLKSGKNVALVSDAGTPGISDEGEEVVRACIAAGIPVVPVPGPSALITALVVSGLPTRGFVFTGFLPRRASDRKWVLQELSSQTRTLVFFEAPHRLLAFLGDALAVLGDRPAVVVRELTKQFEEVARGALSELLAGFQQRPPRGEVTVLVAGAAAREASPAPTGDALSYAKKLIAEGSSRRDAARQAAERFGIPWRSVYRLLLEK